MGRLKDSIFYRQANSELAYDFGSFYLFDSFVVSEINEDVIFSWDKHGKKVTEDIANLYEQNGKRIVFISNRINSYSVIPSDWLKFYKHSYKLKAYGIVSYTKTGFFNAVLEELFVSASFKRFTSLENAILWAKDFSKTQTMAS